MLVALIKRIDLLYWMALDRSVSEPGGGLYPAADGFQLIR